MIATVAVPRPWQLPPPNPSPVRYVGGVRTEVPPGHDDLDAAVEVAWSGGDASALEQAYRRFGSLVFTYCSRSLGDREAAAECTQDTFVSAWKARERFEPGKGSLAGWLLGIARYRVLDTRRRQSRIATPVEEMPEGNSTQDHADEVARQLLVARAIESLPERARSVVELAFMSELSHGEIAERLEIPLGTVKSDVRRALIQLRSVLGGEPDE